MDAEKIRNILKMETMTQSQLVLLAHLAIECANKWAERRTQDIRGRPPTPETSGGGSKMQRALVPTTVELKNEIEELRKGFNMDSVEQALRNVKEYAVHSTDSNVDTLQLKLMGL